MVQSTIYDEKNGTLDVKYRAGNTDRYFLVPPKVYEKYFDAKSPDDFFRRFIKDKFPHRPI